MAIKAMSKVKRAEVLTHMDAKWQVTNDERTDDDDVHLSNVIWNGLLYSQEDVDSSSNFVLLCPYMRREDGTIDFLDTLDCPRASRPHYLLLSLQLILC